MTPVLSARGALRLAISIAAVGAALLTARAALSPSNAPHAGASAGGHGVRLEVAPAAQGAGGFAHATEPRPFRLPVDHGPHFEFQTEWWYYTGNLVADDGSQFGFQLTFFRRGLVPGPPPREGLSTNQVYFAHFAVTDVAAGAHEAVERFARGAAGLAGAEGQPFSVWLEDWCAEASPEAPDGSVVQLAASDAASGLLLDLQLRATKPLVAHGDRGLSRKGPEPGNASYYVGYTRMRARGRIGLGDRQAEVAGHAWFDHEWSTSALSRGAVGWDWFSLQLDGGRELMYFQIRRADGTIEPVSEGTLVDASGRSRRLARVDVQVDALRTWMSPHTGISYPSRWRVRVSAAELDLVVEPRLADQEMRTTFVYWEGAVAVIGSAAGRAVSGEGFVELTGYGRSMQGVF